MYYGFDMGGTKIEMGVFDQDLKRVWQKRVATPHDDYQALLQIFYDLTVEADAHFNCQGLIGIGIPGLIDRDDGLVYTTNVPCAKNRTLQSDLEKLLKRPVRLENDANCFALSEAWDDEFRQYPGVLGVILGTGLGGGIVINGKIYSGRNSTAGEIGHLRLSVDALNILGYDIPLVECGCGQHGCIEKYLSGSGFEWLYRHFYQESLSAPVIIENYRAGTPQAVMHVERYMALLAASLGNLLTILDPHLVVIGGGLSHFDEIYRELPKRLPQYLFNIARVPRIEKARYGDAGGVRGAAFLNLVD